MTDHVCVCMCVCVCVCVCVRVCVVLDYNNHDSEGIDFVKFANVLIVYIVCTQTHTLLLQIQSSLVFHCMCVPTAVVDFTCTWVYITRLTTLRYSTQFNC